MINIFNKFLKRKELVEDKIKNPERLEEIKRLRLHDDEVDEILNTYTQNAAKEFDLPIGLVSIVLDDSQYFAGSHGLSDWIQEVNGTPIEWSFCANSVKSAQPYIVEDAPNDDRQKDNPLVTMEGIKCYAGVPLVSSKGFIVGNFCVIGDANRSFTETEINRLKEYSEEAMKHIEERAVKQAS